MIAGMSADLSLIAAFKNCNVPHVFQPISLLIDDRDAIPHFEGTVRNPSIFLSVALLFFFFFKACGPNMTATLRAIRAEYSL